MSAVSARLNEVDDATDILNQNVVITKTKHALETEVGGLQLKYEQAHAAAIIADRRVENIDKVCISVKDSLSLSRHT